MARNKTLPDPHECRTAPPLATGSRLKVAEQGAFLDGYDDARSRERGTAELLDALGASLKS